ncbi:hypothetical protein NW762_014130 [Fusarium torreyae]|uniref:ER transporter 6TM N-terminal domain-containing protein n=1 Tax=Fusarium torreyae TaxID=1237075 RepID=A0A9W8RM90_9HYPO|nr:hypothetical protein NW762_014130 [Fusarium torreyae]
MTGVNLKDPDSHKGTRKRLIPSWLSPRRWMTQLDLDLWSLCMLAKGALAPVLVIAMVANGFRAWRPSELQDPMVAFSIFSVVALTRAGGFQTTSDALQFINRLLKTFLIGYAGATAVSLFALPITCRRIVLDDIHKFANETQDALAHFCDYLQHIKEITHSQPASTNDTEASFNNTRVFGAGEAETAQASLAASVKNLHILLDKMDGNLPYVRNEFALGKLSGEDIEHVVRLLRHILRPLSGVSLFPELLDNLVQEGSIGKRNLGDEKTAALDQLKQIVSHFNEHLVSTTALVADALRFSMWQLEIGKSATPVHRSSVLHESSSTTLVAEIRRHIGGLARVQPKDTNEDLDTSCGPSEHPLAQYLQSMHNMTLEATLALLSFASSKVEDGTMARRRLIYPKNFFRKSQTENEVHDTKRTLLQARQAPDGSRVIDAEHMEPSNAWQRISGHLRIISRLLGSELSIFGLRVAVASFSVAIVAYLENTHAFFIRQRGVWAMIVIVIGMGATSGQSASGFIARILATIFSLALSLAAWYIVVGNVAGVLVLLFIANIIEYYFYVKTPQYFKASVIALVTLNVIIGYELQVKKLGKEKAESAGQPYYPIYLFGPYKLACVVIGCAVSFFWVIFPYPITAKSKVPGLVGESLFNLARFYSHMHNSSWGSSQDDHSLSVIPTGPDSPSRMTLASLYHQQLHTLTNLRAHMDFAKYEPPIGGRFPLTIYAEMTSLVQQTLDILVLMAHVGFSMPFDETNSVQGATVASPASITATPEFPNLQGYEAVLLLCQMSSALQNKQPLPPFVSMRSHLTPAQQLQKLENELNHTSNQH